MLSIAPKEVLRKPQASIASSANLAMPFASWILSPLKTCASQTWRVHFSVPELSSVEVSHSGKEKAM